MKKDFKNFATPDIAKLLKELGFDELCIASYQKMSYPINDSGNDFNQSLCLTIDCETSDEHQRVLWIEKENAHFHWYEGTYDNGYHSRCELLGEEYKAPTWLQIKEWIWDKYKYVLCVDINREKKYFYCVRAESMEIVIPDNIISENWTPEFYSSPITTEMEGIKRTIEFLHKQIQVSV